ncbi:MAG: YqeG family HAD IIIA-type phosphatase [Atopobiaceae bacterium]|nr:YqeG family HAD IIIA-type phosphatase [Atopobiaceae bacterium]
MAVFRPTRYVRSVDSIDVDDLCDEGIRCVLVDRDNTLVPRDTKVAPPEVRAWLRDLRSVGISVCMVSNNFHTKAVCASARDLGCEVVHHAMKPAPIAVHVALGHMGVTKEEAILVGDQLFTDVMAGNLAGVTTVLVRPQSQEDLWYTKILRKVERLFLKNVRYEGE